jgi:peptidoglycan hydrolase-like protein with peptidoglycan-binding domain
MFAAVDTRVPRWQIPVRVGRDGIAAHYRHVMAPLRRTISPRRHATLTLVAGALLLSACGGNGSTGDASAKTPTEQAQQKVDRAQQSVDRAQAEFAKASSAFCGESKALIQVLDRYGQVLGDDAVTVGQVKSGAADLSEKRADVGTAADAAVAAREEVDKAQADLATAHAELAAAQTGHDTSSTARAPSTSTTQTTEPLVPTAATKRVAETEADLIAATKSVDDTTPVAEAAVTLNSAAYAVEVAWLQLVTQAGCVKDEQKAVQAVIDYTTALQTDLKAAGYYSGPIDGIYGPATVEAIEKLQEAEGLPVTGLLDSATERALDAAVAAANGSALTGAATHTAAIQGALKVLGYWDGPVDGVWSDALSAAVSKLQQDLGVKPTGFVDTATLHALEDALAQHEQAGHSTTTTSAAAPTTTAAR